MKKVLFFLITIIGITLFSNLNVYASTVNFYEGEYIDGIYMNKKASGSSTIYYQKARFFRESKSNNFAYCIEPFVFFQDTSQYESTFNPNNLTASQKEKISLIAHFGYGYKNHTETKWYAITQFMIWKTADPTGDFYFTDTLNGKRIEKFTAEINEINNLINNYQTAPSIAGKEINIVEGENINLQDTNNILNNYQVSNDIFTISNNILTASALQEGEYDITLTRKSNIYNKPIIFYQSTNSQNLIETGDISDKHYNLKIKVIKTTVNITKIDSDTQTTTPSGEGKLDGAIFKIYNDSMEEKGTIIIDETCQGHLENLPFGKYYLKEVKAGVGYELNNDTYEIIIDKDNSNIELTLENKIIKKKIEINKTYGETNLSYEENISFDIYDKNNTLITTITTDKLGHAETILPYGSYTIKQKNSTNGYQKVDDFNVTISGDNDELVYNLTDYKIPVPNTKTSINKNILTILLRIILTLCSKKLYLQYLY